MRSACPAGATSPPARIRLYRELGPRGEGLGWRGGPLCTPFSAGFEWAEQTFPVLGFPSSSFFPCCWGHGSA